MKGKLLSMFKKASESNDLLETPLDKINCYKLLCDEKVKFIENIHVVMFKYIYEGQDSVLMFFALPINLNKESKNIDSVKHISERIIDLIEDIEHELVTIDFMDLREEKKDKMVYIIAIKKIIGENGDKNRDEKIMAKVRENIEKMRKRKERRRKGERKNKEKTLE